MIIANGSTSVTLYVELRDSTTYALKTDVTVTDIDIYYIEEGAAISAKADLDALAAADSAWNDNSGFNVGQGVYRIDWPNEAFNGGIGKKVVLVVVCSGVMTETIHVLLSPPVDVRHWLGTAAATPTEAGVPEVDVTYWKGAAAQAMTGDAFARLGAPAGVSVSADIAAVHAKTTNLPADPADQSAVEAAIAAQNDIAAADVLAEIVEGAFDVTEALRLILAATAGFSSGGGTVTFILKNTANNKDRITATVDADGNRTGMVYDVT